MTDYRLIFVFLFSLICLLLSFMMIQGKKEHYSIIKSAVFGTVGYFFIYLFASAGLLWFDAFSINLCSFTVMAVSVMILIIAVIKNKFSALRNISFDKKEFIFFALIIIVSISLTGNKFGFYGMGQDQGVYQTKAIEYMFDNNSNEYDFDYAWDMLEDEEDYNYFRKAIISLQGYYFTGQTSAEYTTENTGGESGLRGIYHGIPTWPAMLALFGKMFGMSHMQECQTIFFVCFLMMVFYIMENFKIKIFCEAASVAVLAVSPQIVWNSKSALTETFLALIMAVFIYYASNENKAVRFLSFIPTVAFSFFHASVYAVMPLFILSGWIIVLNDKRIRNILAVLLMPAGYIVGFFFMFKLSKFYVLYNYCNPLSIFIKDITPDATIKLVFAAVIAAYVLNVVVIVISRIKPMEKYIKKMDDNSGMIIKVLAIPVLFVVGYFYIKFGGSLKISPKNSLVAFSYATGIISVLMAVLGLLVFSPKKKKGVSFMMISVTFLYTLIWATALKPDVYYYFYYGRYIVPYLAIIPIFLCEIYKDIQKFDWVPAICVTSVVIYLDYDLDIIKIPDDTKVEWNIVESELGKNRISNSAIIVDNKHETMLEWMFILKAAGNDVYPYTGDMDTQAEILKEKYNSIYYLHEGTEGIDISEYSQNPFELEEHYVFKHSEDYETDVYTWIGYPNSYFEEDKVLEVYSLVF